MNERRSSKELTPADRRLKRQSSELPVLVRPATSDVSQRGVIRKLSHAHAHASLEHTASRGREARSAAKLRLEQAIADAEEEHKQAAAMLQRRLRHGATKLSCDLQDTVIAVDVSPDGEFFAAGGLKSVAVVYRTMTGKEVARIKLNSAVGSLKFTYGPRTCPAETEDGAPRRTLRKPFIASDTRNISQDTIVTSGSLDEKAPAAADQKTGRRSRSIFKRQGTTDAPPMQRSTEGKSRSLKLIIGTFSTGDRDNIHLVDVHSNTSLATARFGRDGRAVNVHSSAVSRNGTLLAVGGVSQMVNVYSLKCAAPYESQTGEGVAGKAGGSRSGSMDSAGGPDMLWEEPLYAGAVDVNLAAVILSRCSQVEAVSMDAAGTLLGIAGDSRRVELWSLLKNGQGDISASMAYQFNCHVGVFSLAISQDGKLIAAGTSKRTEVWKVRSSSNVPTLKQLRNWRTRAARKRTQQRWLSAGEFARSVAAGKASLKEEPAQATVISVVPSAAGSGAAGGASATPSATDKLAQRTVNALLDAKRTSADRRLHAEADPHHNLLSAKPKSVSNLLHMAMGSEHAGGQQMRHPKIECEPVQIFSHPTPQGGVAFSADASRLVIGGDQLVSLHDVQTGSTLRTFRHDGRVRCVALSALGIEVVSGGFDKRVSLCCADAGAEMSEITATSLETVRCIDVQGNLLAIGGSVGQYGMAQLFDIAGSGLALHQWRRTAEVRCVKLTESKSLLAIAGHDCLVQLMCTVTFAKLCELNYAAKGGPPRFIWSVDISSDLKTMAVGCWSFKVHVYSLAVSEPPAEQAEPSSILGNILGTAAHSAVRAPVRPTEIAVISRGDRVYSVALDQLGRKLLVGGRDKRAAMYDLSGTISSRHEAPLLMWEEVSDEFIYSVSVARNFTTCAFGGMSKTVRVLSAQDKQQLCEIAVAGTVHCVSVQQDGSKLAISGELPTLTVYDRHGSMIICLPTTDEAFGVALTPSSLAFTKQRAAVLYGKAGVSYGWQDQPSWEMAAHILRESADEPLYQFLRCVLSQHPSLVNSRAAKDGCSFLQHVVCISRDPDIIDLVLSAVTVIGLLPDATLTTALHTAVEMGNRTAMKRILRANLQGKLSRTVGSMRQIFSCFELIAARYPHDYLEYIREVQLEAEPEVLDQHDTADVSLPGGRMLVKGSYQRYPRRLWARTIAKYRTVKDASLDDALDEEDDDLDMEAEQERWMEQSALRAPRDLSQSSTSGANAPPFNPRASASRLLPRGAPPEPPPRHTTPAGQKLTPSGRPLNANSPPAVEPPLDQGISVTRIASSGLQAMRVPFPNFGGTGVGKRARAKGNGALPLYVGPSPLQLISQAARATGDYKVFGATIVEATLQHKWETFARRQFYQDLALYLAKMFVIYVHVLYVLFPPEYNGEANPIIGIAWVAITSGTRARSLIVTWALTTAFAINDLLNELRQLRVAGSLSDYLGPWNIVDLAFISSQLASNAVFALAALSATASFVPDEFSGPKLYGAEAIFRIPTPSPAEIAAAAAAREAANESRRQLKAGDILVTSTTVVAIFDEDNTWTLIIAVCEALVLLCVHIKLLYYARGFQKLGVLVRMIIQIMEDMASFLLVLAVILLGFGLSIYLLQRHRYTLGASSIVAAVFDIVDAGLYAALRDDKYTNAGIVQLVIFTMFMIVTQVVLLNLLIAIMSDSYAKVRGQAELAAKYELAQVVQEVEQSPPFIERLISFVPSWRTPDADKFPRWLHVLLPESESLTAGNAESEGTSAFIGGQGNAAEYRLEAIQGKLDVLLSALNVSAPGDVGKMNITTTRKGTSSS